MSEFQHKQIGTPILIDELTTVTIKNRTNAVYEQMTRNMNNSMFGDREPFRQLTRMEFLRRRANVYRQRVIDSWLVLTGRADIGGDG